MRALVLENYNAPFTQAPDASRSRQNHYPIDAGEIHARDGAR